MSASILLPYQRRWLADTSPVAVCEKGRRIGLSWGDAGASTLYSAAANGNDTWYIGYNKEMAQEYISDAAMWAKLYQKAASDIEETVLEDDDKDIITYRISFASGHRISALSSRPTTLRGKQGRAVIDEAAFHDDLPGLMKAALAFLMWGGRVRVISTHFGDDNPFNELVTDIRAGKKPYSLHRITFDDALADGLFHRIAPKLKRPDTTEEQARYREEIIAMYGDDADEELFCIPSQGTGFWLPRALVEGCMKDGIPVFRHTLPPEFAALPDHIRSAEMRDWCDTNLAPVLAGLSAHASYVGEDFARSGDKTVIALLCEDSMLGLKCPFVVELANVPFREQESVVAYICDRLPNFRGAALDARGNGQYLAERAMQRYGHDRVLQVMLSESWYREEMPPYKAALEDRRIILPRDADILDDHRLIVMHKGVAKVPENRHTTGTDGLKRHGDAAVAFALAHHASRANLAGPVSYDTVASRPLGSLNRREGF